MLDSPNKMTENIEIEKSIQENFKKLSRGLMQPSYPDAYQSYKKLYEIGPPVIPILKTKIFGTDWSNSKYKELSNYISGLFHCSMILMRMKQK